MPVQQMHFWLEAEAYANRSPSTEPSDESSETHSLDELALILPKVGKTESQN